MRPLSLQTLTMPPLGSEQNQSSLKIWDLEFGASLEFECGILVLLPHERI